MSEFYIWWINKWDRMMIASVDEEAGRGNPAYGVIPGHIQLALQVAQSAQGGDIVTPITIDRDSLLGNTHENWGRLDLLQRHVGIAFESVHLPVLSKYPGIITDLDFKLVAI